MEFLIRGEKIKVTDSIKNYIEEKQGRLNKYFDAPDSIKATALIKVEDNEEIIEVTIPTTKFTLRAEEKNKDLYAAIDLVTDKLERQIRKNKTRLKAKYKKERYSIEFSDKGIFQDVEIEVKSNKIPDSTFSKISGFLSQRHKKYKIEKVQIQYAGDRNLVLMFLRENRNNSEGITISYEVVISTKMDGNYLMLEYLFSETGEYLLSNEIISRRNDTIDY